MGVVKRYFIRIPPGEGVSEAFVPVDPHTLHKGVITQLYEWDTRRRKHIAILGMEGLVGAEVDSSELLEQWAEFVEQLDFRASEQTGASAKFMTDIQAAMAEITKLITSVASGQLAEASGALNHIGYALVQGTASASHDLTRFEAEAKQHRQQAESVTDILANQDERTQAEAMQLADTIEAGLRAHRVLSDYEAELDQLYARLEPFSHTWGAFANEGPQWLRERLDGLANSETGFCRLASSYLLGPADPDAAEAMATAVTEARREVRLIHDRIAVAQAEHVQTKASAETTLTEQFGIENQTHVLRDCRTAVVEAQQKGIDAFSLVSGLITVSELHQWQQLLQDPNWQSLHAVRVRLREKADSIRRLLDQTPRLSEPARRIIGRTELYISKLEEALTEFGLECDEAEAAEAMQAVTVTSLPPVDEKQRPLDDNRLEELYELMLAVGAIKYCGPQPLRLGTPGSMLKILHWLGHLTESEMKQYTAKLEERIDRDSRFVEQGEDRLAAWQEINPAEAHWIKVRQHRGRSTERYPMWKLVEQARDKGLSLAMRYGLDPLDVAKASDAIRGKKAPPT